MKHALHAAANKPACGASGRGKIPCLLVKRGVTVTAQIFVPYHLYVRILRWLCLALLAYVITALLPAVKNDWGQIARNFFIPSWSQDPAFIMTVVEYLGTTISPCLFFWQAGQEVEEEIADSTADAPGHRTISANLVQQGAEFWPSGDTRSAI
jgi:Mn2+/Fe2+ NRAMP family transporter